MNDIAPMIATVFMMLAIAWIVRFLSTNRRLDRLAKMHNELQHKIIDKFGSTQEMLDYLETDPGKRLLDAPVVERSSPYGRILASVQTGIVLVLAGVAFLAVTGMVDLGDAGERTGFVFVGVLGLALGVGFLVSAYAAHVLSKSYGLIDGSRSGSGI